MPREHLKSHPFLFDVGPLGHIEGLTISDDSHPSKKKPLLRYFGGLPYALPPVGPYRFRRPRPLPDRYRYGTKASPGRFTRGTAFCPQPSWRGSDDSLWDEDCLQLNIYIPIGAPPPTGWPVFFFIHGGFLQWGDPNMAPAALAPLLGQTAFEAIVVMPAYRVNLFGFLAGRELQAEAAAHGAAAGNMGFWDQRLALEWTAKHIRFFGGDGGNITVGGYSAGAHSVFQQLAHELYAVDDDDDQAVIRRAIMWSNSPGVQPKSLAEHQRQFDELLGALEIPLTLSAQEKLRRVRAASAHELVAVQDKLKLSEFRALTDGAFVSRDLMANINSGDFARRMKARGIKLMNGECRDEHNLYQTWRTPAPSYDAVFTRLCADYPERVVRKLMDRACGPSRTLPSGATSWPDLFGRLYADMQVHGLERGFLDKLSNGGLAFGTDVLRYRFEWRARSTDAKIPPAWGVTHSTDMAIWFWDDIGEDEVEVLRPWNELFAKFVKGEAVEWGMRDVKDVMRLKGDGTTDVWSDELWEEGLEVWDLVNGDAGAGIISWLRSKL